MPLTPFDPNNNPFAAYDPKDQVEIKRQLTELQGSGKLTSTQSAGVSRALRYLGVEPGPLELPGMPTTGLRPTTRPDISAPTRSLRRGLGPTQADTANAALQQASGTTAPAVANGAPVEPTELQSPEALIASTAANLTPEQRKNFLAQPWVNRTLTDPVTRQRAAGDQEGMAFANPGTFALSEGGVFGPITATEGIKDIADGKVLEGTNKTIEGAFETLKPALTVGRFTNPIGTYEALYAMDAGSAASSSIAKNMGAGEEGQRLAGNLGAFAFGAMTGGRAAWKNYRNRVALKLAKDFEATGSTPAEAATLAEERVQKFEATGDPKTLDAFGTPKAGEATPKLEAKPGTILREQARQATQAGLTAASELNPLNKKEAEAASAEGVLKADVTPAIAPPIEQTGTSVLPEVKKGTLVDRIRTKGQGTVATEGSAHSIGKAAFGADRYDIVAEPDGRFTIKRKDTLAESQKAMTQKVEEQAQAAINTSAYKTPSQQPKTKPLAPAQEKRVEAAGKPGAQLRAQILAVPGITERHADAVMALLEGNAKYHGMSLDDYANKFYAGIKVGGNVGKGALYQAAQTDLGFKSKVGEVVEGLPNKMTGRQAFATLVNKGAKREELAWTGLDDFLQARGDQPVTKAELQQHIQEHGVQLNEVQLGETSESPAKQQALIAELRVELDDAVRARDRATANLLQRIPEADRQAVANTLATYQFTAGFEHTERRFGQLNAKYPELQKELHDWGLLHLNAETARVDLMDAQDGRYGPEGAPRYREYSVPGGKNYREFLLQMPVKGETAPDGNFWDRNANYESPHWDEPNVLVHVRTTDRTDAEGKKVLFVEEIQSDWHQHGRDEGYRASKELASKDEQLRGLQEWLNAELLKPWEERDAQRLPGVRQQIHRLEREISQGRGVPDAPFKDTWHELAIKRIMRRAAEEGYDRVAFSPAEVHTNRWGTELAAWKKGTKERLWKSPEERDTWTGSRPTEDGFHVDFRPQVRGRVQQHGQWIDLEAEAARRGLQDYAERSKFVTTKEELAQIAGSQLKPAQIDRLWERMQANPEGVAMPRKEGFDAFYEQKIPNYLSKFGKKFGAKLQKTGVDQGKVQYRTPSNLGEATHAHILDRDGQAINTVPAPEAVGFSERGFGVKYVKAEPEFLTAHTLDITPEMRKSVLEEGQYLFQKGKNGVAKGAVEFAQDGRALITAFERADVSTLAHEAAHVFRKNMKDADRAVAEKWLGIGDGQWETKHEEWFARGFEKYLREGKAPNEGLKQVFENFKTWLTDIYKKFIGGAPKLTPEARAMYDRLLGVDSTTTEAAPIVTPAPKPAPAAADVDAISQRVAALKARIPKLERELAGIDARLARADKKRWQLVPDEAAPRGPKGKVARKKVLLPEVSAEGAERLKQRAAEIRAELDGVDGVTRKGLKQEALELRARIQKIRMEQAGVVPELRGRPTARREPEIDPNAKMKVVGQTPTDTGTLVRGQRNVADNLAAQSVPATPADMVAPEPTVFGSYRAALENGELQFGSKGFEVVIADDGRGFKVVRKAVEEPVTAAPTTEKPVQDEAWQQANLDNPNWAEEELARAMGTAAEKKQTSASKIPSLDPNATYTDREQADFAGQKLHGEGNFIVAEMHDVTGKAKFKVVAKGQAAPAAALPKAVSPKPPEHMAGAESTVQAPPAPVKEGDTIKVKLPNGEIFEGKVEVVAEKGFKLVKRDEDGKLLRGIQAKPEWVMREGAAAPAVVEAPVTPPVVEHVEPPSVPVQATAAPEPAGDEALKARIAELESQLGAVPTAPAQSEGVLQADVTPHVVTASLPKAVAPGAAPVTINPIEALNDVRDHLTRGGDLTPRMVQILDQFGLRKDGQSLADLMTAIGRKVGSLKRASKKASAPAVMTGKADKPATSPLVRMIESELKRLEKQADSAAKAGDTGKADMLAGIIAGKRERLAKIKEGTYVRKAKSEAGTSAPEAEPAKPVATPNAPTKAPTAQAVGGVPVLSEIAQKSRALKEAVLSEYPFAEDAVKDIQEQVKMADDLTSEGRHSQFQKALNVLKTELDKQNPHALREAFLAAIPRRGEAGYVGATPRKFRLTSRQVESAEKFHVKAMFDQWEAMTESQLAQARVSDKLHDPMFERSVQLANDPKLLERFNALKGAAGRASYQDPIEALTKTVTWTDRGGETPAAKPDGLVNAMDFSPADIARGAKREYLADAARQKEILYHKLDGVIKSWDKRPIRDSIGFIDKIEKGDYEGMAPEDRALAQQLRTLLDDRRDQIMGLGEGHFENYLENYFPHIWTNVGAGRDLVHRIMGSKRPLGGPEGFLKKRTINFFAEGLKEQQITNPKTGEVTTRPALEPVSYNPVKLALTRLHEMDRFLMAHRIKADLQAQELLKFYKHPTEAPDGWTKLDDRTFSSSRPAEKYELADEENGLYRKVEGNTGFIHNGDWYAPRDAAKVINNYLSPGLAGRSATFDFIRGYGNALNQAQLGISFFHLTFTGLIDTPISTIALGAEQATRGFFKADVGQVRKGVANMGKGFGIIPAITESVIHGNRMLAEYLEPGRFASYAREVEGLVEAGGRVRMDPYYKNNSIEAFRRTGKQIADILHDPEINAWAKATKAGPKALGYVLKGAGAGLEAAAKPVMEWVVPRMKLGLFYKMAEDAIQRIGPDAPQEVIRAELGKAWDSVDNRMGQLVYDNLDWNRTGKDLAMLSIRSVGWNYGTWREVGGGAKDAFTSIKSAVQNRSLKGFEITRRTAYIPAMVAYVGFLGALTNFFNTGELPQSTDDYFFPRTGKTNPDGTAERVEWASYLKDLYPLFVGSYKTGMNLGVQAGLKRAGTMFAHKIHPWAGQVIELWNNADYYGREVVHTGDNPYKQSWQIVSHFLKGFEPLTFRNAAERRRSDASVGQQVMAGFGLVPAPKWIGNTPAMEYAFEMAKRHMEAGPNTQERAEKQELRRQLERRIDNRSIPPSEVYKYAREGKITWDDADAILDGVSEKDPLLRHFKRLPDEGNNPSNWQALETWKRANKEEQRRLFEPMQDKLDRALDNLPPDMASQYLKTYRESTKR